MLALSGTVPAGTRILIRAFSKYGSPETFGYLLSEGSDGIRSRGGNTQAKILKIKMDGHEQIFNSPTEAVRVVQRRSKEKSDQVNGWECIYIVEGPHQGQTLAQASKAKDAAAGSTAGGVKQRRKQSRKRQRTQGGLAAAAAGGADDPPPARSCSRLHEILNLDPSTSPEGIRKAYMEACRLMHPDKNPDNQEALAAFQELQEAHNAYNAA